MNCYVEWGWLRIFFSLKINLYHILLTPILNQNIECNCIADFSRVLWIWKFLFWDNSLQGAWLKQKSSSMASLISTHQLYLMKNLLNSSNPIHINIKKDSLTVVCYVHISLMNQSSKFISLYTIILSKIQDAEDQSKSKPN